MGNGVLRRERIQRRGQLGKLRHIIFHPDLVPVDILHDPVKSFRQAENRRAERALRAAEAGKRYKQV